VELLVQLGEEDGNCKGGSFLNYLIKKKMNCASGDVSLRKIYKTNTLDEKWNTLVMVKVML
jgi:hypothetical protein